MCKLFTISFLPYKRKLFFFVLGFSIFIFACLYVHIYIHRYIFWITRNVHEKSFKLVECSQVRHVIRLFKLWHFSCFYIFATQQIFKFIMGNFHRMLFVISFFIVSGFGWYFFHCIIWLVCVCVSGNLFWLFEYNNNASRICGYSSSNVMTFLCSPLNKFNYKTGCLL